MNSSLARWLKCYGVFLLVVAAVAVMYEPRSGRIGFNPAAKTALISGGICGGLSLLWGLLSGFRWTRIAALISTSLFFAAFTWRSIAGWMAFADGQTEKWYASTLISLMWAVTAALLVALFRNRSNGSQLRGATEPALSSNPNPS